LFSSSAFALIELRINYLKIKHPNPKKRKILIKNLIAPLLIIAILFFILFVLNISFTPAINSENAITEIRRVELNNNEQSIVIRGQDKTLPILLWVDGGPGGTEIGWTRSYLSELEKHFVFVNWDQAGTGKSFGVDISNRSIKDYVDDLIALTEYLREFSPGSKIYLAGHSWGSIIALKAIEQRPDLFKAYLAIGQFVNAEENDGIIYEKVLADALRTGNMEQLLKFKSYGPPPYNAEHQYIYDELLSAFSEYETTSSDFNQLMIFSATEQSVIDKINMIRGYYLMSKQFNDEINRLDLEKEIPEIEVPIYFFSGARDFITNKDIAYRYFQNLKAPLKEFYWFDNSSHYPCFEENEKFIDIVVNEVLINQD
jgi:pimeloyl-ACP methyl ester carboxylesterase